MRISSAFVALAMSSWFSGLAMAFAPGCTVFSKEVSSEAGCHGHYQTSLRAVSVVNSELPVSVGYDIASKVQVEFPSEFVNDGLFAWIEEFIEKFGLVPGKQLSYGIFAMPEVDDSQRTPPEEAARLREEAAENLYNIDIDERNRQKSASEVSAVMTMAFACWAALIGDEGDFGGHLLRLFTIFPLFVTIAYRSSAASGLSNIAQSGMWAVDGNGLSKIEDPALAKAILEEVNSMNYNDAIICSLSAGGFAILPQTSSSNLMLSSLLCAILYALEGKLPETAE